MSRKKILEKVTEIQDQIFTFRGVQVMIDRDLATLYQVETRVLNQAVKRNIRRFPSVFMFQLTEEELKIWISQIVISNKETMGIRNMPYVFTEQGVSMLSAVLKSDTAIDISIQIMNAFVEMRKFISTNAGVFQRLENVEQKQIATDKKFEQIFKALESKSAPPNQGIFYDGQVFDAYVFVSDLIKSANSSIVLIDNYVDESVLQLLCKKHKNAVATIYTKNISKVFEQDIEKHNIQYPEIKVKTLNKSHDRFLIIDENTVYHFGASLKDLGKKWFAFSRFDKSAMEMLTKLD